MYIMKMVLKYQLWPLFHYSINCVGAQNDLTMFIKLFSKLEMNALNFTKFDC